MRPFRVGPVPKAPPASSSRATLARPGRTRSAHAPAESLDRRDEAPTSLPPRGCPPLQEQQSVPPPGMHCHDKRVGRLRACAGRLWQTHRNLRVDLEVGDVGGISGQPLHVGSEALSTESASQRQTASDLSWLTKNWRPLTPGGPPLATCSGSPAKNCSGSLIRCWITDMHGTTSPVDCVASDLVPCHRRRKRPRLGWRGRARQAARPPGKPGALIPRGACDCCAIRRFPHGARDRADQARPATYGPRPALCLCAGNTRTVQGLRS
jgi:hypothetical protein